MAAAELIETQDLLVDDDARATWDQLDKSEQDDLLVWVNTPRSAAGRRRRLSDAVVSLQQGTAKPSKANRPGIVETLLDGVDALLRS
jgi:hypothetical protein